jgi:hypothetical protein
MTDETIRRAFLRRIYGRFTIPVEVEYHLQYGTVVFCGYAWRYHYAYEHVNGLGCWPIPVCLSWTNVVPQPLTDVRVEPGGMPTWDNA